MKSYAFFITSLAPLVLAILPAPERALAQSPAKGGDEKTAGDAAGRGAAGADEAGSASAIIPVTDPVFRKLLEEHGANTGAEATAAMAMVLKADLPESLRYSLQLSNFIDRVDLEARYRERLAMNLLESGLPAEAEAFAETIPGYRRQIVWAKLARDYGIQGKSEKADKLLEKSGQNLKVFQLKQQESVQAERAVTLAALGRFDEAGKLATTITERVPQSIAESGIESERHRQGMDSAINADFGPPNPKVPYPERVKIAEAIREIALRELAEAKASGGDPEPARETIQTAVDAALQANCDVSGFLIDTADALRAAGEDEAADRMADFIAHRIEELGMAAEWRNGIVGRLSKHYPEEQRAEVAKMLEQAAEQLEIGQPSQRAAGIVSIAQGWLDIGEEEKAMEAFERALEEARKSKVPRNWAMAGIDVCMALQGRGLTLTAALKERMDALLRDVPEAQRKLREEG